MRLIFDTETTGMVNWKLPPNHETQPRLVQLAFQVLDKDNNNIITSSVIIKPEGWAISKGASDVHGITDEIANKYGVPLLVALATFNHASRACEERVAHNLKFDDKIIAGEFLRVGKDWAAPKRPYCTMQLMTPICQLAGGRFGDFKWPTLMEAYRHIFKKDFEGAHNALIDVDACKEILIEYIKQGLPWTEAQIR